MLRAIGEHGREISVGIDPEAVVPRARVGIAAERRPCAERAIGDDLVGAHRQQSAIADLIARLETSSDTAVGQVEVLRVGANVHSEKVKAVLDATKPARDVVLHLQINDVGAASSAEGSEMPRRKWKCQ